MAADRLSTYRAKRDFARTAEPGGSASDRSGGGNRYLIQKHDATRMHFDFRLEHGGVLLSWAVPNGPSYDPAEKRLAVHVEDHPLDYGDFEGTIPKGNYGGGTVMLWDEGSWDPVGDADAGLSKGDLKFVLHGRRLRGQWVLVRMKPKRGERGSHENWLLIKEKDAFAGPEKVPIVERGLTSVRSGRTMAEIAAGNVEWVEGFRFKEAKPGKKRAGGSDPPAFVAPQLAASAEAPPAGNAWLHEIKFDGYRTIAAVGSGRARIFTRTGLDWTDRFKSIVWPLADLPCHAALIDGETIVRDAEGRSSFGRLQESIAEGRDDILYCAFDLLALDGEDLRKKPLSERKKRLAKLLDGQAPGGPIFYSDHVAGHGAETFAHACDMGLEGIVSKRADAPYRSGRTKSWVKVKCGRGQELIVLGWQPSTVRGRPFASLLVATRDEDRLAYRGRVGSGFGEREFRQLWPELEKRQTKTPPAADVPPDIRRKARFVKPELVIEVAFAGWTDEGYVRQAAFKGLRGDKPGAEVTREMSDVPPADKRQPPQSPAIVAVDVKGDDGAVEIAGVRVTHPDRVVFAGQAITKRQLAAYYLSVKDLILPHVADRPLSLVRFPSGADGDGFFQKHASPGFPDAFKPITIREKEGKGQYLYIEDERGLIAAVQMGVLELHIWGAHNKTLEKPDRLVFDFDPDEAVDFAVVRDAAREMRERLKHLGLQSFAMATGGKGIHVVVPLTPHHGWEDIRAFAEAMARTFAAENPDRFLAEMSKTKRKGRIFIDYLRNTRGATAIAPFSTRARKGAPLAWPVAWTALNRLSSAHGATVENAARLLARQKGDPWRGYFDVDQVLPLDRLTAK